MKEEEEFGNRFIAIDEELFDRQGTSDEISKQGSDQIQDHATSIKSITLLTQEQGKGEVKPLAAKRSTVIVNDDTSK